MLGQIFLKVGFWSKKVGFWAIFGDFEGTATDDIINILIEKLPKMSILGKKSGLLPGFILKVGRLLAQYSCGFAGFLPTFPTFLLIYLRVNY